MGNFLGCFDSAPAVGLDEMGEGLPVRELAGRVEHKEGGSTIGEIRCKSELAI